MKITVKEISRIFEERISGQEETKKKLAAAVAMHYQMLEHNKKSANTPGYVKKHMGSILLYGPSGSGKTEFFRALRDSLGIPVIIWDTTSITASGYKGDNLTDLLVSYYGTYKDDADSGIFIFDEFDKVCDLAHSDTQSGEYARSFLNEFLKLVEGKEFDTHDTGDILMVMTGSFGKLVNEKKTPVTEKVMGFGSAVVPEEKQKSMLTNKDFIQYGITPELMGRISVICNVDPLTKDALKSILLQKTTSPIKGYQEVFAESGNELKFTNTAIDYIVDESMKYGLGARGLQKVLTPYMLDVVYETDGMKNIRLSVTGRDMQNRNVPRIQKRRKIV